MKRCLISVALSLLSISSGAQVLDFFNSLMSQGKIARAAAPTDLSSPFASSQRLFDVETSAGVNPVSDDFDFVLYLLERGLNRDAHTLLFRNDYYSQSDTLMYLRACQLYASRDFCDAAAFFREVPTASAYYDKSFHYAVGSEIRIGDFQAALSMLEGHDSDLARLQRCGTYLLTRDFESYHRESSKIGSSHYSITQAVSDLSVLAEGMQTYKEKKQWVAGLASAVVPGLGKIYAGRTGEGVLAFLTVGSLGAICAENWVKCGVDDPKTIIFGALGALCYISNIYGSCVAVRLSNQNTLYGYETAVLVDLSIPLATIFR